MTTYVEGRAVALVTARFVAMLAVAPSPDGALATLADALSARGLAGFIDALIEATGTTASSLPEFAVAIAEEHGIRVAVRGKFTLTDTSEGALGTLTGIGVTGWSEAVWEASTAVDIVSTEEQGGGELWIVEGAVRASAVHWSPSTLQVTSPNAAVAAAPPARSGVTRQPAPDVTPRPVPDVIQSSSLPAKVSRPKEPLAPAVTSPEAAAEPDSGTSAPAEAPVSLAPLEAVGLPDADSAGGSDDEISIETLASAYDTVQVEQDEAAHESDFDSLWGSTIALPRTGNLTGEGPVIAAVPGSTPAPAPAPAPAPGPSPAPPPPPLGSTDSPVSAVPIEPLSPALLTATQPPAPLSPAESPTQVIGDHDGATVSIAALRAMTSGQPASTAGNASSPTFATAEQLAKERRGRALISNGAVVTLDKNVIVGRTPKASRVTGEMPHLVTVPSPTQDISRSHVELRVEGTAVVAIDLNTTNGTIVRRSGAEPARLHPGEPHVLLTGDVIDIGDGVTITMEDLP